MNKFFRTALIFTAVVALPAVAAAAGARETPASIEINLSEFRLTISKWGDAIATYPISYGGGELVKDGAAPSQCVLSSPPEGHSFGVIAYQDYSLSYASRGWDHAIFFKRGYLIRTATHNLDKIGTPSFTCGAVVLSPADAKALFDAIADVDHVMVEVRVVR